MFNSYALDTGILRDFSRDFPQSLQTNAGIVSQSGLQHSPSKSSPIHHLAIILVLDTMQSRPQNIPQEKHLLSLINEGLDELQ